MKRVLTMIFVSMWRVFCLDDPKQRPRRAVYTITLWLNHIPWEVINFRTIREHQSWDTTQHNLFTTWQINLKWPTGPAWAGSMETHTSPCVKQIARGGCHVTQGAQLGALWWPRGVGWGWVRGRGCMFPYGRLCCCTAETQHGKATVLELKINF